MPSPPSHATLRGRPNGIATRLEFVALRWQHHTTPTLCLMPHPAILTAFGTYECAIS